MYLKKSKRSAEVCILPCFRSVWRRIKKILQIKSPADVNESIEFHQGKKIFLDTGEGGREEIYSCLSSDKRTFLREDSAELNRDQVMWAPVETTTGSLYGTLKTHHTRSDDDASSSGSDDQSRSCSSSSNSTSAESPSSSNSSHRFIGNSHSHSNNHSRSSKSKKCNQLRSLNSNRGDEEEENNITSEPASRCKHACCCDASTGYIYLFAGRSGNTPFRDLWRFDPKSSYWSEIRYNGHASPPFLQEHTMISWGNKLYVFGGEVGFSSNGETPLWIFDLGSKCWRKAATPAGSLPLGSTSNCPAGRRGHSAVIYDCGMHIYGGYQDLRGSSSELWTFDLTTEHWHLITCSGRSSAQPSARHYHSAVVFDGSMWILGGMTDLNERSDFWHWSFGK